LLEKIKSELKSLESSKDSIVCIFLYLNFPWAIGTW
jgi:hypothetical protein